MNAEAPKGEKTTYITLFAIKYAKQLQVMNYFLKDLVYSAGLRESCITELNKGIRLNRFVEII